MASESEISSLEVQYGKDFPDATKEFFATRPRPDGSGDSAAWEASINKIKMSNWSAKRGTPEEISVQTALHVDIFTSGLLRNYLSQRQASIASQAAAREEAKAADAAALQRKAAEDAAAARRIQERQQAQEQAEKARLDAARKAAQDKSIETAERARLNEQAALMLNIEKIIDTDPSPDVMPTDAWLQENYQLGWQMVKESLLRDAKNSKRKRRNRIYNNFAVFRSTDAEESSGGGHLDFTKFINRHPSLEYLFSKIKTSHLSMLVPSVKLYKVFYPSKESTLRPQQINYMWRIPFDDLAVGKKIIAKGITTQDGKPVQVNSEDHSDFILGENNEGSIEEILAGRGRLHSVGIKSFKYKYVGTNPAEVNTNIEAELEIYLQDIRDLVKEIQISKYDPNFLPIGDRPKNNYTFTYADLVADSTRDLDGRKGVYNPEYFRILAVVGYAQPPDNFFENMEPDEKQTIKEAIDYSKALLYLTPITHDLQFTEDGTVNMKIKYIAAATSAMVNVDALSITRTHERIRALEKIVDAEKDKIKAKEKELGLECNQGRGDALRRAFEAEELKSKATISTLEDDIESQLSKVYSELFSRLVGIAPTEGIKGQIYTVVVSKYALGISDAAGIITEDAASVRIQNIEKAKGITDFKASTLYTNTYTDLWDKAAPKSAKGTKTSPEAQEAAAKAAKDEDQAVREITLQTAGKDKYIVKFVFLGDILDILLTNIKELGPVEKPRILLTDFKIDVPIPVATGTKGTPDYKTYVDYAKVTINLADIPISLNMLEQFMFKNIVKARRKNYPINLLITDLITQAVGPAISPGVFGKKAVINKSIKMSTLLLNLNLQSGTQAGSLIDPISQKGVEENFNGIIYSNTLASLKTSNPPGPGQPGNYLVIYANQIPSSIKARPRTKALDKEDGIFHCFIGTDSGMVKKINFSKTNLPFYKEAKATNFYGNKRLLRLREIYDVNIEMFGNNVFKPGDFLYVQPLFFTGKTAVSLQQILGLGGYYQVIDVETSMNMGTFQTNLRCVLVAHLDEKTQKVKHPNDEGCLD